MMLEGPIDASPIHRRSATRPMDGLLLLDKPVGPSSNQVLQQAKRLFGARKAGHTGTLDPFASGLLPIAFGEATKFSGYLLDSVKVYEATLILGVTTTTGDLTGEVVERARVTVTREETESVVRSFVGPYLQVPPMYSALKRNGVPLYRLARRGESVVREPRNVHVFDLQLIDFQGDEVGVRLRCSKGLYVRVLAEDIGKALGCGASVRSLRRLEVAAFSVSNAVTFEALEQYDVEDFGSLLLPVDSGLEHIPVVLCDQENVGRILRGQSVALTDDALVAGTTVRIYVSEKNQFVGLGRIADGRLQPIRLARADCVKIS